MPSCRKIAYAALTLSMALAFVAIPFRVTVKEWQTEFSLQSAFAKDGKGNGNGNGGGKSNGNSQAGGNGKGSGNGKSEANEKGSSGKAAGKNSASDMGNHTNPSTGDIAQFSGKNIDVLHRNGMREGIKAGRYIMKDAKGRTIVDRRAISADEARLRAMVD